MQLAKVVLLSQALLSAAMVKAEVDLPSQAALAALTTVISITRAMLLSMATKPVSRLPYLYALRDLIFRFSFRHWW